MSATIVGLSVDRRMPIRRVLLADGIVSGGTGVLLTLAAGPLHDLFGLPEPLLRIAGLSLLPFAAFVIYLATRQSISRRAVWGVVMVNLLWAIDSLVLLITGWAEPTTLGFLFTIGQALLVATFADLQYLGLRRSR